MGIENDIQELFKKALAKHNGNAAATARYLQTNPVTFWLWLNNVRGNKKRQTLFRAIELAGGKLVCEDGENPTNNCFDEQIQSLKTEVIRLKAQLELLKTLYDAEHERLLNVLGTSSSRNE